METTRCAASLAAGNVGIVAPIANELVTGRRQVIEDLGDELVDIPTGDLHHGAYTALAPARRRLHLDFYVVAYETNGVPGDTFKGRWSGDLTRFDVKAGAVPRAFNLVAVD